MKKVFRITMPAKTIMLAASVALISGCSSNKNNNESATADSTGQAANTDSSSSIKQIFYALPSPIETALIIQSSGAKFDKSLLNATANSAKYNTSGSKAINLGIYGSDLAYATVFGQAQECNTYLKTTNELAGSLGINGSFGESIYKRLNANLKNQDSLLRIVSEAYLVTDSYLKENERPAGSALIIAGGWIEGLHISSQLALKSTSAEIKTRVGEQKMILGNLLGMLDQHKNDADVAALITDLQDLKSVYDSIEMSNPATEVKTDETKGVTTIGKYSQVSITDAHIKTISDKVEALRNKLI